MNTFLRYIAVIGVCLIAFAFTTTKSYPIDGYATTGIKRLLQLERLQKDSTFNSEYS